MVAPSSDVIQFTHGYHPVTTDLEDVLRAGSFEQLLVFGPGVKDVFDLVDECRVVTTPPVQLPQGVYWFSGAEPAAVLFVASGAPAAPSAAVLRDVVPKGTALDNALQWVDAMWDDADVIAKPRYPVGADVIVGGTGQDGVVRPGRRYVGRNWLYTVFSGGQTVRRDEASLSPRPTADDASTWVTGVPVPPSRFAATLTRAKLSGHFTDTMFSFRATRTLFRPYQFKPVQKLLDTGTLRLLIADEVGLGKTIEAGLVWTEMEARRQADRVLVVCPSSLVQKWKREMEDRFGFVLLELDNPGLTDVTERLQTDRLPRRVAYISSIERLRMWPDIERASELGLQFDLTIVDEAHAFRNSDTKSFGLGEHLQDWSDALVMLTATPVNLRNQDLFNLLSLLVPGEFEDLESLENRLAPNAVLNKLLRSLTDAQATNADRRTWLGDLERDAFGRALARRPDFAVLREVLSGDLLDATGAVAVKRLCAELHGLSAQVTRTRKIDVQEEKAIREARSVPVTFDRDEAAFYETYFQWCVERAAVSGSPLNFAMQMPLRLAGSCLPEAARYVLEWNKNADVEVDDATGIPATKSADIAPVSALIERAAKLTANAKDTKYDALATSLTDLRRHGRKAIVFTFSRRTLRYLEQRLGRDFRVAVLHGGVAKRLREKIMADFRRGAFDFLLASKVASEGLDFEFCSAVVNYDLPWNPMEVEQRIGRIDRIGQREKKIGIWNFHTPGTIETDIVERVMDRIKVFEHSIGQLEPILESEWKQVERLLFDFSLTWDQRRRQAEQAVQALEMQAQDREFVESAAPLLISSDGADIDGLERDLVANGRYVGQSELGLLVEDWAEAFGGTSSRDGKTLRIRGNAQLADHVQTLVRTGERTGGEVHDLASRLRAEVEVVVSLDQELSRTSDLSLLTANHALTRAAVAVPGYRHGRFTLLRMSPAVAGVGRGTYLALLARVEWDGVRPVNEVWSSSIDLLTLSEVGDPLGAAIMRELATASYLPGPLRTHNNLSEAVDLATMNLEARVQDRRAALMQENNAFIATRRASFDDVHQRRLRTIEKRRQTQLERNQTRMIPLTEGKLRKEKTRYEGQVAELESASAPSLTTNDLAVCVVEVTA